VIARRWPALVLLAVVAAAPARIPLHAGGEQANLLVPLYAVIAVLADDPAAYTDIPSWCTMKAHEFVAHAELPQGGWALYIRRRL